MQHVYLSEVVQSLRTKVEGLKLEKDTKISYLESLNAEIASLSGRIDGYEVAISSLLSSEESGDKKPPVSAPVNGATGKLATKLEDDPEMLSPRMRRKMIEDQIYLVCHNAGVYKLPMCILEAFRDAGMFCPELSEIESIVNEWRMSPSRRPRGLKIGMKRMGGECVGVGVMMDGVRRSPRKGPAVESTSYFAASRKVLIENGSVDRASAMPVPVLFKSILNLNPRFAGKENSFSALVSSGSKNMKRFGLKADKASGVNHIWVEND